MLEGHNTQQNYSSSTNCLWIWLICFDFCLLCVKQYKFSDNMESYSRSLSFLFRFRFKIVNWSDSILVFIFVPLDGKNRNNRIDNEIGKKFQDQLIPNSRFYIKSREYLQIIRKKSFSRRCYHVSIHLNQSIKINFIVSDLYNNVWERTLFLWASH